MKKFKHCYSRVSKPDMPGYLTDPGREGFEQGLDGWELVCTLETAGQIIMFWKKEIVEE